MKKPLSLLILLAFAGAAWAAGPAVDGQALYARCQGCHGADGTKAPMHEGKPLKGMSAAEVSKDLHGYKNKTFGGAKKAIMEGTAARLSDAEIEALAQYIAKF